MSRFIVKDGYLVYGPEVHLTDEYADGGDFRDPDTRTDNAEYANIAEPPAFWFGGVYRYHDDGSVTLEMERLRSLPIPDSVDTVQAMLAIDLLGHADAYEAWANDQARTFKDKVFRDRVREWKRADPVFNAATDDLGFSESQKDDFFRLAQTL